MYIHCLYLGLLSCCLIIKRINNVYTLFISNLFVENENDYLRNQTIIVKVTSEEKVEWKEYASSVHKNLSELVRDTVNRVIRGIDEPINRFTDDLQTSGEIQEIKGKLDELTKSMEIIKGNLPQLLDEDVEDLEAIEEIKRIIVKEEPQNFQNAFDIINKINNLWVKGNPSTLDLAVKSLRKDGIISGERRWRLKI